MLYCTSGFHTPFVNELNTWLWTYPREQIDGKSRTPQDVEGTGVSRRQDRTVPISSFTPCEGRRKTFSAWKGDETSVLIR